MEINKYEEFLDTDSQEEFGVSREDTRRLQKGLKLKAFVICPLCGFHRPVHKTGTYFLRELKRRAGKKGMSRETTERILTTAIMDLRTGRFVSSRARIYNPTKETSFNKVNIDREPFIVLKKSLGRGGGFEEVYGIRLDDLHKELSKDDLKIVGSMIDEIEEQCKYVLNKIKTIKGRLK